jgi:hypothetical protein
VAAPSPFSFCSSVADCLVDLSRCGVSGRESEERKVGLGFDTDDDTGFVHPIFSGGCRKKMDGSQRSDRPA